MTQLRLQQHLAGLYLHRHSLVHLNCGCHTLLLCICTEQVSPDKPKPSLLHVWVKTVIRRGPKSRARAQIKAEHQGMCHQRRESGIAPAASGAVD